MDVQSTETETKPRKPKRKGDMPWHEVKKLNTEGTYGVADLLYVVVYVRPGETPEDKPIIKRVLGDQVSLAWQDARDGTRPA